MMKEVKKEYQRSKTPPGETSFIYGLDGKVGEGVADSGREKKLG